ncbi:MAG: protein kinase [Planctomycetes bacterium]|nr:protein kinase [Planctomycetota bacterium]
MIDRVLALFGQIAVGRRYATAEQVKEALGIQRRMRDLGLAPRRLGDILVEKGYLSPEQVDRVARLQEAGRRDAIPGYEVLAAVGHGAMGVVYRARQLSLDRPVAIKVLAPRYAEDPAFVERFLREAKNVARLNHPGIVAGIDVGTAGGLCYFVMEYVEGTTLAEPLRRGQPVEVSAAAGYMLQLARALDHVHRAGIVHRDIKPDNVIIALDGTAKLLDLGVARRDDEELHAGMVGTPYYMPPEQARRSAPDGRADLYSLGATFFHVLGGRPPYDGEDPREILRLHLTAEVPSVRALRAEVPESLDRLLARCMAKDPAGRPVDAAALVAELEAIRDSIAPRPAAAAVAAGPRRSSAPPTEPPAPSALRFGLVMAAGALVLLAAVWGVLWAGREPAPSPPPGQTAPPRTRPGTGTNPGTPTIPATPTDKGTTTDTSTPTPPPEAAAVALLAAYEYLQSSPEDVPGAAERLRAVVRDFPGTPEAGRAQTRLEQVLAAWKEAARSALEDALDRSRALAAEGSYGAGVAVLEEVRTRLGDDAELEGERVAQVQALEGECQRAWEALEPEVRAQADRGEMEEALARVRAFREAATAALRRSADRLRDELETSAREASLEDRARALLRRSRELAGRGDLAAARAALDQGASEAEMAPWRPRIDEMREALDSARSAWERLWATLRGRGDTPMDLVFLDGTELRGTIRSMDEATWRFTLKRWGRHEEVEVVASSLAPATFLALAAPGRGAAELAAAGQAALFAWLPEVAAAAFEAAQAQGYEPPPLTRERMAAVEAEAAERRAAAAHAAARRDMEEGRWREALDGLTRIREAYATSRYLSEHAGELAREEAAARRELTIAERVAAFYGASVRALDGGGHELEYGFRDESQGADWVSDDAAHPASTVRVERGRLVLGGCVRWRGRMGGDVQLAFDARWEGRWPNIAVCMRGSGVYDGVVLGAGYKGLSPDWVVVDPSNPEMGGKPAPLPGHLVGRYGGAPEALTILGAAWKPILQPKRSYRVRFHHVRGRGKIYIGSTLVVDCPLPDPPEGSFGTVAIHSFDTALEVDDLRLEGLVDWAWVRREVAREVDSGR